MQCDAGFCDGPDPGPGLAISASGGTVERDDRFRQYDREAMLTNGIVAHQDGGAGELEKLRALAAAGKLFRLADSASEAGGVVEVTAGELDGLVPSDAQYSQDVLPARAAGQVYFYRIMAVSRAGIQEYHLREDATDLPQRSTISPPFAVPLADFDPPLRPALSRVLTNLAQDAIEIAWTVDPDAEAPGAGYALWRAALGEGVPHQEAMDETTFTVAGLDAGSCYRIELLRLPGTGAVAAHLVHGLTELTAPRDPSVMVMEVYGGPLTRVGGAGTLLRPGLDAAGHGVTVETITPEDGPAELVVYDRVPAPERDHCYVLELTDGSGQVSERSTPLAGARVDLVKPDPPVGAVASAETGCKFDLDATATPVIVEWTNKEGGLRATIKRSARSETGPWRTLASRASPDALPGEPSPEDVSVFVAWPVGNGQSYRFRDDGAAEQRKYWYRIELFDAAGNKSAAPDGVFCRAGRP
jgi:hypothetical protein